MSWGVRGVRVAVVAAVAVLAAACSSATAPPIPDLAPTTPGGGGAGPALTPTGSFQGDLPTGTVPASLSPSAFYRPPNPLPSAPPGNLISTQLVQSVAGVPTGAVSYRVLYHSTDTGGNDIAVSGMVVIPGGKPPPGGFPIVSWAHGTTGVADRCAPSLSGQLFVPALSRLVSAGFIVAATDYEGLGTPGVHPYLVGDSEGRSVLDAARAARNLVRQRASDTVFLMGHSQGGQAALFAGELAPVYAPDLYIAGVIAAAPVTDVGAFVPGTPPSSPVESETFALLAMISWSEYYPSFPLRSALTAYGARFSPVVDGACADRIGSALATIPASQLFVNGWNANPQVAQEIQANEPGGSSTPAPILIVQGGSDQIVSPELTTSAVAERLCGTVNDTVQYDIFTGATHTSILDDAAGMIFSWVSDRMNHVAPPSNCGLPPTQVITSG